MEIIIKSRIWVFTVKLLFVLLTFPNIEIYASEKSVRTKKDSIITLIKSNNSWHSVNLRPVEKKPLLSLDGLDSAIFIDFKIDSNAVNDSGYIELTVAKSNGLADLWLFLADKSNAKNKGGRELKTGKYLGNIKGSFNKKDKIKISLEDVRSLGPNPTFIIDQRSSDKISFYSSSHPNVKLRPTLYLKKVNDKKNEISLSAGENSPVNTANNPKWLVDEYNDMLKSQLAIGKTDMNYDAQDGLLNGNIKEESNAIPSKTNKSEEYYSLLTPKEIFEESVVLYPNPVATECKISWDQKFTSNLDRIYVTDLITLKRQISGNLTSNTVEVNLSNYKAGVYGLIFVMKDGNEITKMLIKQ